MKIDTKFINACLLLFTLVLLSACTIKPVKKEPAFDRQSRQAALALIDSWKMHARIGLQSKDKSGSATLIWDEKPDTRHLRMLGPLGGGLIQLKQDATVVTIQDSNGRVWLGGNARELIHRVTGWQIPVSGLRWWLLGLTEPGSKAEFTVDESQRLHSVQQSGWRVILNKYAMFSGYELPTSIVVESANNPDDDRHVRVKLIVKEWKITN